jgi:hypothetical protein
VPLASIKAQEGGALFPDDPIIVAGRIHGQPRMSNLPVSVVLHDESAQ